MKDPSKSDQLEFGAKGLSSSHLPLSKSTDSVVRCEGTISKLAYK